ncbi:MAG: Anti-sigma-B factor antagonist [bacterium ADurb.Bin429]|nr:MAG: Anti-sigma-B factor antagonist [bacterium ADurb.Bin429]
MGTAMNLEVQTRCVNEHLAVVAFSGEIDVYTSPQAREVLLDLLEKGYYHLVVDLRRTDYLDSTGLGLLKGALVRAQEQGGSVRLVAPPPKVQKLLEVTYLVTVFPIDATEQDAIAHLTQEGTES